MPSATLIDTHAHIYLDKFQADIDAVITRAQEAGVQKILLPNIDLSTIESMLELTVRFPGTCYPMMGLHPCSVGEDADHVLNRVEEHLANGDWVGVGETGIDLYWDRTYEKEQEAAFRRHIEWAKELQLPVVIHSRDSLDLNIGIVEEMQDGRLTGVFHCFNGNAEQAKRIRDAGLMMGLGGVITFKNAGMKEILPHLDMDYVVLETDAPYLSPVPYRGKRNESGYLAHTAAYLASTIQRDLDEVAGITTANALRLFPQCETGHQGP